MVTVEMRNGIGFDLEVASSRPVGLIVDGESQLGYFEGWVLSLPFFVVLWGDVFMD